ncbi:MAG TPA: ArsR family transcriptional regulator, partial [Nevskiaceae bacterium]|nr:ArsR family transcriptional regulator [Nevskiaceae bacterium]
MVAALEQALAGGPLTAAQLATALSVSQPTVSRLLRSNAARVIVIGRARNARYALRRSVRDLAADLPVYRIALDGSVR